MVKWRKISKIRTATIAFPIAIPCGLRPFGSTDLACFFVQINFVAVIFFFLFLFALFKRFWRRCLWLIPNGVVVVVVLRRGGEEETCHWVGNRTSQVFGSGAEQSRVGCGGEQASERGCHFAFRQMFGERPENSDCKPETFFFFILKKNEVFTKKNNKKIEIKNEKYI